jgi:membrane protein
MDKLKSAWQIICLIAKRFVKDRFTYSASALTYTTLLSIVPLMTVFVSILAILPFFSNMREEIEGFIFKNFVPGAGTTIQTYLQGFLSHAQQLPIFATLFFFVTVILLLLTVERALNDVWRVKRRRYSMALFLRYWAILSLTPILAGLSIAASTYIVSLPFIKGAADNLGLSHLLLDLCPFALSLLGFTLLYTIIPNCRVKLRYGFFGALAAAILFEIAKHLFVLYLTDFKTYEFLYGALATIPIFLLWIYISWVIVLFGALVSQVLATHSYNQSGRVLDGFTHAFLWLGLLWHAQQSGRGLSLAALFRQTPGHYCEPPENVLDCLFQAKLVTLTNDNTYVLSSDFSTLTLADLYRLLPWKMPSTLLKTHSAFSNALHKSNHALETEMNIPLAELYKAQKSDKNHD